MREKAGANLSKEIHAQDRTFPISRSNNWKISQRQVRPSRPRLRWKTVWKLFYVFHRCWPTYRAPLLQEKTNSRINNVIYDPRWHPFRGEKDKIGGDREKEAKNPDENPNKLPHSPSTWYLFFDTSALSRMLAMCIIVGIIVGGKQNVQLNVL